jgi:gamma-glutamyltranspeptidase/glutathione hydrolase
MATAARSAVREAGDGGVVAVPGLLARRRAGADARRPDLLSGQGIAPAGLPAATVTGAVYARLTLLRDHGTQPSDAVLRHAIEHAETGHPLLPPGVIATVASVAEHHRTSRPTSATTWLTSDGAPPDAGRLPRTSVLASTHRRLLHAARGPSREAQIDAVLVRPVDRIRRRGDDRSSPVSGERRLRSCPDL